MEGVTGYAFRKAHAECFGELDRYYTPFLVPPRLDFPFANRYAKELCQEGDEALDVVPQLLTKNADEFVWATQLLSEMGYAEVNLNVGCPSGTVANKGRGAGFLRDLTALEAFLQDVCVRSALPVSVKTRIGFANDNEFEEILETYCRCPIAELIVHPRVRADFYDGTPRREAYGEALAKAPYPVAYNGDIFGVADVESLVAAYPETRHVMLGRGVVGNPALPRMIKGGPAATADELERFHDVLFHTYEERIGGNAVFRMKEWWSYAKELFVSPISVQRAVRKLKRVDEYEVAVSKIFRTEELVTDRIGKQDADAGRVGGGVGTPS